MVTILRMITVDLSGHLVVTNPVVNDSHIQQYDILSHCRRDLISFLSQEDPKSVMQLLYNGAYVALLTLLQPFLSDIKDTCLNLMGILRIQGPQVVHTCMSVKELFSSMNIAKSWNDVSYLRAMLGALPPVHRGVPSAILDHYEEHLFDYRSVVAAKKRLLEIKQSSDDLPSKDVVEVGITVKNSIQDLSYRGCHDVWRAVLVEGAGIPRDKVDWISVKPSQSTTVCFHIPKEYASRIAGCMLKGRFLWMLLELRVIKVQISGIACFWITWNNCNHLIKDALLTGGDLFRFTKVITCAYFIKYHVC